MSDTGGSGPSLRKKTIITKPIEPKRRKSCKLEICEEQSIEDIYCQVNAKTDFNPTPLETIYESPKGKSQGLKTCMGMVKLKRHFRFTTFYNPSKVKIKMRKNKVRKLKRIHGNLNKSVTVSLEQVEKVLQEISEDENEENHVPCFSEKKVENVECQNQKQIQQAYESEDLPNFDVDDPVMEVIKEDKLSSLYLNSERSSYERKLEDFIEYDDCNIFSPGKLKYDKSKRERRQSRRFLPLCTNNSNIDAEGANEQSELIVLSDPIPKIEKFSEQNEFSSSFKVLDPVMQVELPSLSCKVAPCDSSKPVISHSARTKGRKKAATKSRRNSGTNRSIYKSFINSSFNDSNEESSSFNNDNVAIKNTLSPTSLMDQLRIESPEPSNFDQHIAKKGRRRSARLSLGRAENFNFGTVWIGSESPNKDDKPLEIEKPSIRRSLTNEINTCSQTELISNCEETFITEPVDKKSFDTFNNAESPILSGIFDCQARLTKDKSLKRKRGSSLTLGHFTFNS